MNILVVCTANLIRSPVAAAALSALLVRGDEIQHEIRSAGIAARAGQRPPESLQQVLRPYFLDVHDHAAQQLTVADVRWADLVVTMTEDQRESVRSMLPGAVGRTFTLRELGRLCLAVPATEARGCAAVAVLHRARPQVVGAAAPEDVADPAGASTSQLRACVKEVTALVDIVGPRLG